MKRLWILVLTFIVSTSSSIAEERFTNPAFNFLKPYSKLLEKHVLEKSDGEIKTTIVDYSAWSTDPLHEKSMNTLKLVDPYKDLHEREEKLAFWINAYNLFTIDLIIKERETESIKNLGGMTGSPWKAFHWQVGEEFYTLNDIKFHMLIPLKEARIHFALSKASLSSPDLKAEPYTADSIYSQLEEQSRAYLKNPYKGILIEEGLRQKRTAYIPELFKEHISEFAQGDLRRFINRYVTLGRAEIAERYRHHNWHLNSTDMPEIHYLGAREQF